MLVLADTDTLRVDLDQLGQRVHQPATDADSSAYRDVVFGKLLPSDLGRGVDRGSVFADYDSFKRLLKPSIETEFSNQSKAKADEEAIRVFAENLRQLLLAPPLGQKRVLGVDPGYRTGCKLVCLDAQGNLLHNEAIFPHPPQNEKGKAAAKVAQLVATYAIDAIAIGNGTASRETEQ